MYAAQPALPHLSVVWAGCASILFWRGERLEVSTCVVDSSINNHDAFSTQRGHLAAWTLPRGSPSRASKCGLARELPCVIWGRPTSLLGALTSLGGCSRVTVVRFAVTFEKGCAPGCAPAYQVCARRSGGQQRWGASGLARIDSGMQASRIPHVEQIGVAPEGLSAVGGSGASSTPQSKQLGGEHGWTHLDAPCWVEAVVDRTQWYAME